MKKLIATALIAAMSLTMLAGCGNGGAAGSKDVTDVALKVWVPQNQLDTGIIEEQQKSFAELHPEWNITWTTEIVGEDVAKELNSRIFPADGSINIEIIQEEITKIADETKERIDIALDKVCHDILELNHSTFSRKLIDKCEKEYGKYDSKEEESAVQFN